MKTLKSILLASFLCVLVIPAHAQTALSTTTLSSALTNASNSVCLTSTTGVTSPVLPVGTLSTSGGTISLYVDHEYMTVIGAPSAGCVQVRRGQSPGGQMGRAVAHNSLAPVTIGLQAQFATEDPTGACTATSIAILPRIVTNDATVWNCPTVGPNTGIWIKTGVLNPPSSFLLTDNTQAGMSGLQMCHARYSFAVDGGAVSTITPATNCTIPINAIIYRVLVNNVVAPVGSTGNVSVGLSAGAGGTAALMAATARGSLTIGTIFEGVPVVGTASTSNTTLIKMTAAGTVTVTVATNALTAGILDIAVQWYLVQA